MSTFLLFFTYRMKDLDLSDMSFMLAPPPGTQDKKNSERKERERRKRKELERKERERKTRKKAREDERRRLEQKAVERRRLRRIEEKKAKIEETEKTKKSSKKGDPHQNARFAAELAGEKFDSPDMGTFIYKHFSTTNLTRLCSIVLV